MDLSEYMYEAVLKEMMERQERDIRRSIRRVSRKLGPEKVKETEICSGQKISFGK